LTKIQIINCAIGLINDLIGENMTLPLYIIEFFISCKESVKYLCYNKKLLDDCLNGLGKSISSKNKNMSDKNKKSIIKIYSVLVQNPNGKKELNRKIPKVLFNKKFYDSLDQKSKKYMDSFYSNFLENDDKRLSKIICDIIGNESVTKIENLKNNNENNGSKCDLKDFSVLSQTSQLGFEANFSHLLADESSIISNTTNSYYRLSKMALKNNESISHKRTKDTETEKDANLTHQNISTKCSDKNTDKKLPLSVFVSCPVLRTANDENKFLTKGSNTNTNNVVFNEYNNLRNSRGNSEKRSIKTSKKYSNSTSGDIFEECLTIKDQFFQSKN
jgi:hypothetical protein